MTITQAARYLGVSRTLIYRAIAEKRITPLPQSPLYKGRGPRLIPVTELDKLRPQPDA